MIFLENVANTQFPRIPVILLIHLLKLYFIISFVWRRRNAVLIRSVLTARVRYKYDEPVKSLNGRYTGVLFPRKRE